MPRGEVQTVTKTARPVKGLEWVDRAELTVLVDNNPWGLQLKAAWGLSMLVNASGTVILFDTGPDPGVLAHNARVLGIDLSKVDLVVISHEHGDHVGGLPLIASLKPGCPVYVPAGMSRSCKRWIEKLGLKPVEVANTTVIARGVAVVGQLKGPPWEQGLAVHIRNLGLIVLVGCSHPGVVKMVKKAMENLNERVYMVIGGFHLSGCSRARAEQIVKQLVGLGVKKIAPVHCSGETVRSVLREFYPENYVNAHVGYRVSLEG